jgi:hypothetical protein
MTGSAFAAGGRGISQRRNGAIIVNSKNKSIAFGWLLAWLR